ncbi:MAG: hypothetical protein PHI73_04085 [Patescibacteria group bacterium]|nr:hypothetical protein [Patescibacteria group bacterium]
MNERESGSFQPEVERPTRLREYLAELEKRNDKRVASREEQPDGRLIIETREGEKYTIERLTDPEDPRLREAHALMSSEFSEDVMDDLETLQSALAGKVIGSEEDLDTPLQIHIIEREGRVVGTSQSATLKCLDSDGSETGKKMVMVTSLVTEKSTRQTGAGTELWRKLVLDASRSEEISAVVDEAAGKAETFYETVGMRRLFIELEDGTMAEIPYYQSVLADSWNKKTGEPLAGNKPEPLHFSAALLDRETQEMTTQELMSQIRGVMNYDSYQVLGYFKGNRKAFDRHEEILGQDLARLEQFLAQAKDGKVHLLTKKERKESGKTVVDHKSLDD